MSARQGRVLLASTGTGARVHAVDETHTVCGRKVRASTHAIVEWGSVEQVTCRACRRKLAEVSR